MQRGIKGIRRREFLKSFSDLMVMCVSPCWPAVAWFELAVPDLAVSTAAAGPAPTDLWALRSVCQMRTPLSLAIHKPRCPAQTAALALKLPGFLPHQSVKESNMPLGVTCVAGVVGELAAGARSK